MGEWDALASYLADLNSESLDAMEVDPVFLAHVRALLSADRSTLCPYLYVTRVRLKRDCPQE